MQLDPLRKESAGDDAELSLILTEAGKTRRLDSLEEWGTVYKKSLIIREDS